MLFCRFQEEQRSRNQFFSVCIRYLLPLYPASLCFSCESDLEALGVVLLVYFFRCYVIPDLKWCFSHPILVFIYLFNENMYSNIHTSMFNVASMKNISKVLLAIKSEWGLVCSVWVIMTPRGSARPQCLFCMVFSSKMKAIAK